MENYVKKWVRRFAVSGSTAMLAVLIFAIVAIAVPVAITNMLGTSTDTTITLTWTKSATSDNTVIRYSTTSFPSTPASGTSAYSGTASYVIITGLTAGTPYYFSAWGYDGSNYSTTALELCVTTRPAVSENVTAPLAKPTIPAEATQDPDISGWSINPIDDIIDFFADESEAHGGLGMPADNVVMFIAGVGVTFVSIITYVKWRSFWSSWFISIILCSFLCTIEVMQWIVVGFLLLAGAGVWAIEKSTQ